MKYMQYPALDLLRALAAFEVLLVHVRGAAFVEFGALPDYQHTPLMAGFFAMTRLGQEAVMVFFVLSGFLVGGQVIRRVSRGIFDIRAFAVDRTTRLLIPLVPAVLIASVLQSVLQATPPSTQIFGNMLGLNDLLVPTLDFIPPLWSLTYEIWFYILAGAIGSVVSSRSPLGAVVICCCVLVFAKLSALYLLFWALGAGAASFYDLPMRKAASAALIAVPLVVFGVLSFQISYASKSFENHVYVSSNVALALIATGIALSLPFLVSRRVSAFLKPVARLSSAAAAFSYTLYLTHYPVEMALDPWLGRAPSVTAASLTTFGLRIAIALITASVLYWLFERNTPAARSFLIGERQ